MEGDVARPGDAGKCSNGLQGADLRVCGLDRHQHGLKVNGAGEEVRIDPPVAVDRKVGD